MTSHSEAFELYQDALADYKSESLQTAVEKLQTALELDGGLEDAYEALSVILYDLKKYDEAIQWIKKWILVNPNSVMSHTNLSRCYVAKDMILEAEQEQAEARRLGWKEELQNSGGKVSEINHEAQIQKFKQVIEYDPKDVLGYYSLGNAYWEAGKKRDASDAYEKAVDVDPSHSSSYLGLGIALVALGDLEKAKKIFTRGIITANQNGDLVPLKKMEAHLRGIEKKKQGN